MPAHKLGDKQHSLKTLSVMQPGNGALPQNNSHQYLMEECCEPGMPENQEQGARIQPARNPRITPSQWITVIILFYVNLINYMDRYTIAGVLSEIKEHYNIGDDMGGLLQTVFVISYMLFAPLFGYLGDRYNRRFIMAFGVFLWCLTTLVGSFMQDFGWFLTFRTFVGIGEASYSTVAPTIISDLFVADVRSKMLAVFYFAIPVGSGLGYIIGSETADATSEWQWGLRVTPILGAVAVFLILFAMIDPERGQSEGRSHVRATSWASDVVTLCKNKSFVLSSLGFTCVAFVAGALAWWGPRFIYLGRILQDGQDASDQADVSFKFGVITMVSGVVGVPLGSMLAQWLRPTMPRVDPIICAVGLIVSAPVLFIASLLASTNSVACYILIFIGEVALNLNWSIVADILLYVVTPTRRSSAEALQILISHALGDAGSPYLVGLISELLKTSLSSAMTVTALSVGLSGTSAPPTPSPDVEFHSLQYALFTTSFVEVLGGFFFLLTALYIVKDRAEAEGTDGGVDNPGVPTHLCADDPLSRSELNLTVA